MRPFLATCLGAVCTAALALPLAPAAGASAAPAAAPGPAPAAQRPVPSGELPGSTQSLPVAALGAPAPRPDARDATPAPAPQSLGLPARAVRPFSLLGVVWDDAAAELRGRVQVRTRATGSGDWSGWRDVQVHNDDAPDLGSAERRNGAVRGSTAPLWVGDSDAVQLRITPDAVRHRARAVLPGGLRLELVDPGDAPGAVRAAPADPPAPLTSEDTTASAANTKLAPLGATEIPALDQAASLADLAAVEGAPPGHTYVGPRPRIVTRAGWGADEQLREKAFTYTRTVRAAFVHHSGSGNDYDCAEAPALIRAMYRFHIKSNHWRDIGYNFLIDKCGTVYEGRAGGVAKPVMGAHTLGFNTDSTGIAVLGTFTDDEPPQPAVEAIARLTAWKLGLYSVDPRATIKMLSGGGNRFPKGTKVPLHVISGHRDGFTTDCPGVHLYNKLAAARRAAASLQGR